ncbi:kinase-like domain-containing protein [Suillus bovinus]|uniref:kinase-like domain-containing protein n=1 Tax=Suillus bovinus TaxID=48563 RepID=UPI001B885E15|nr:kinase-like domain-containing protein [Suillus bovinus]KAG2138729.1 kinase-like domain-containing protein [Suillus bovinus]
MNKVPTRIDGRFKLEDILGSGSYAVMYRAVNFLNDDVVAIKLEPPDSIPSVECEYRILKQLEGGVGIPRALWRPATLTVLTKPAFLVDFGIAKRYWNITTETHVPFCQGQHLTGTPAFASINNHLGLELCHCDDLESLAYMLIYFLHGSLPWLTSDDEELSSSFILEHKVDTTIADLCAGIPAEFTNILVYSHALSFSEDPDYNHLLCGLCAAEPAPATCSLDFSQPNAPIISSPISNNVAEITPLCISKATPLHKSTHILRPCNDSLFPATTFTPHQKKNVV